MEMIDFQNGDFFRELAFIFSQLDEVDTSNVREAMLDRLVILNKQLNPCIKKYTGMDIEVKFAGFGPVISMVMLNKNHALLTDYKRSFLKNNMIKKDTIKHLNKVGTVNIKTGKVTGLFSELNHVLYIPLSVAEQNILTPEEWAAVVLHEVGHAFVYCEYIHRTTRTNLVLEYTASQVSGAKDRKEVKSILLEATKELNLKDVDVDELSGTDSKETIKTILLGETRREIKSELGTDLYDETSFEMLADNFAARHGAGRHLATALAKTTDLGSDTRSSIITTEILTFFGGGLLLGSMAFSTVMFSIFLMPVLVTAIIASMLTKSGEHDKIGLRLQRIRNQLVTRTKDKLLSKEEIAQINEDIKTIDKIGEPLVAYAGKMTGYIRILDWISDERKRIKIEKVHSELEYLMANDLFLASANLRNNI